MTDRVKEYLTQGFILAAEYFQVKHPLDKTSFINSLPSSIKGTEGVLKYGNHDNSEDGDFARLLNTYFPSTTSNTWGYAEREGVDTFIAKVGLFTGKCDMPHLNNEDAGLYRLLKLAENEGIYPKELREVCKDIKNTDKISWSTRAKDKRSVLCTGADTPFAEMNSLKKLFEDIYSHNAIGLADAVKHDDLTEVFKGTEIVGSISQYLLDLIAVCTYVARLSRQSIAFNIENSQDGSYLVYNADGVRYKYALGEASSIEEELNFLTMEARGNRKVTCFNLWFGDRL